MEIFVQNLLETSDLSFLTKKLVRQKYCDEVGRELTVEEKHTINSLVQDFVNKLAEEQRSSPDKLEISPGNKENTAEKVKKSKQGKAPKSVPLSPRLTPQKSPPGASKKEWTSPRRASPEKKTASPRKLISPRKKRIISPRLKVEEVLSAVLNSDGDEVSEEMSEDEEESQSIEPIDTKEVEKGVERLKAAREKKIQMSQEKKQKFSKQHAKHKIAEQAGDSSDSVLLISETDNEFSKNGVVSPKAKKKIIEIDSSTSGVDTPVNSEQGSPIKIYSHAIQRTAVGSALASSPLNLNKSYERTYLGVKVKLKTQVKSPLGKSKQIQKSPKIRKRKVEEISDSEDESVINKPKRRKFKVSRNRLDSTESELSELPESVEKKKGASRRKRNFKSKGSVISKERDIYSLDSKSSSTETNIMNFMKRKRKLSTELNVSRSRSASNTPTKSGESSSDNENKPDRSEIDKTPVKSFIHSSSSSEAGDTPVKKNRKGDRNSVISKKKTLQSLVKSRNKSKQKKPVGEHESDTRSEQDSETDHKLSSLKFAKVKKLETKTKREKSTDESDNMVDSEDETLSSLRQNGSKISEELETIDTVDKTELSSDGDENTVKILSKAQESVKVKRKKNKNVPEIRTQKKIIKEIGTKKKTGTEARDEKVSLLSSGSSSDSELSDNDEREKMSLMEARNKREIQTEGGMSDSGLDSDDSEDIPLARLTANCDKKRETKTNRGSKNSANKDKSKDKGSKSQNITKKSKSSDDEPPQVKRLRKIVRACGIMEWADQQFKNCKTNKLKLHRLRQILEEAGMTGKPSMKKAENIKLQKEAAELSSKNIISTESSCGKRKVISKYSKRTATPSPKKQIARTPVKKQFSGLQGIIDSEASDED